MDEAQACILVRTFITAKDSLGQLVVVLWRPLLLNVPRTLRCFMTRNGFTLSASSFLCLTQRTTQITAYTTSPLNAYTQGLPDGMKVTEGLFPKTKEVFPLKLTGDPKKAARWAKHSLKDRSVLLDVLFWATFNYVQCTGPLVVTIHEAAYGTCLGSTPANNTLFLGEESRQMQQDYAGI